MRVSSARDLAAVVSCTVMEVTYRKVLQRSLATAVRRTNRRLRCLQHGPLYGVGKSTRYMTSGRPVACGTSRREMHSKPDVTLLHLLSVVAWSGLPAEV